MNHAVKLGIVCGLACFVRAKWYKAMCRERVLSIAQDEEEEAVEEVADEEDIAALERDAGLLEHAVQRNNLEALASRTTARKVRERKRRRVMWLRSRELRAQMCNAPMSKANYEAACRRCAEMLKRYHYRHTVMPAVIAEVVELCFIPSKEEVYLHDRRTRMEWCGLDWRSAAEVYNHRP